MGIPQIEYVELNKNAKQAIRSCRPDADYRNSVFIVQKRGGQIWIARLIDGRPDDWWEIIEAPSQRKMKPTRAMIARELSRARLAFDDSDINLIKGYISGPQRAMDWDALPGYAQGLIKPITMVVGDRRVLV